MKYPGKDIIIKITEAGCHEVISHKCLKFGHVTINRKIDGIQYNLAHRYFWALSNGHPPSEKCVCHKCDNPKCVNIEHLFLGTRAENNSDRHRKGRTYMLPRTNGTINGMCKLTPEKIIEIRLAKGTMSQEKLAKIYGLSQTHISQIHRGARWAHL